MHGHFFRSVSELGLHAFTRDETGAQLPARGGPWEHIGQGPEELLTEGRAASADLLQLGYHLFRGPAKKPGPFEIAWR